MKRNRLFSTSTRAVAVLLAGLLLAAGHPTAGQIVIHFKKRSNHKKASAVAMALAQQVGLVQQRFGENRRALPTVKGPLGEPAYARSDVAGLITRTGEDLDQAIAQIGEPGLEALRAWSAAELRPIQEQLAAPTSRTAALPAGLFTPRAVAVVASLGRLPLPELEGAKAAAPKKKAQQAAPKQAAPQQAAPQQATIGAEKANGLLEQVGEVVSRIFFLASHDDLEVKLWVGSTPAKRVTFRFWPQGNIKGSEQESMIIRTNDDRDHVLRGLYSYQATWSKGSETQSIEYPKPAGTPDTQQSERLDLVRGSGFFCCDFGLHSCQQVANAKQCRPSATTG